MVTSDELDAFRVRVDAYMAERYGVDWEHACGSSKPLERAIADGESAEAFVDWYCRKFALKPVGAPDFWECERCGRAGNSLVMRWPPIELLCPACAVA